ncbi:AraC family transcriptional regulator [Caballeronia humi]|uniref:HTH araC/xylS-type domain-containing protein n=1 Tax=Caballeronia humi TaxID=326474 RepID=A0A158GNX9_9BURK|nr:AraC family transcriptional regulator [Caballeronia humi]SAL33795.1 hypothetical protein AWB65_02317 [Caballeronia humi]
MTLFTPGEGTLPLIDVAARTGLPREQHFTEVFHRYVGWTPRAFRRANARSKRK